MSFFVGQAYAQSAPDSNTPDGLIKIIVADVITSIKSDPEIQKGNIPRVVDLVEKKIVPHTDMRRTTQLAMGKNWSKASPEQQNQLIMEFKNLTLILWAHG